MGNIDFFKTFTKFTERVEIEGISPELITEIIAAHTELKSNTLNNYGRYQQALESTPILVREFKGDAANKINSKLANDFFSEIVDTKVGYVFGVPIIYAYDKNTPEYEKANETIKNFNIVNNMDDINAEMGKFAAMCGYDAGLLYIDSKGQERIMRVDPWETIILSKTEINDPQYGIRYFDTWDNKQRVEFYDNKNKFVYEDGVLLEGETKPNLFDFCPLFGVPNNAELQGDADKVLSLIDAYDRSISDMSSEIEQFRLAYMVFVGYAPDDAELENMKKTGALYIPTSEDGEDIKWLVKNLDPKYPDSHLDRVEANITRFAKHVNFTDAFGGGQVTGPAMKYKLFALETKSKYFERKHEAAMRYMYKVLATAWSKKGITFDYTKLDLKYTRNIPVNIVDEATAATTLSGITSKKTALSTLSIVTDVDEELQQIQEEQTNTVNLDDPNLLKDGKGNPIVPNNQGGVV